MRYALYASSVGRIRPSTSRNRSEPKEGYSSLNDFPEGLWLRRFTPALGHHPNKPWSVKKVPLLHRDRFLSRLAAWQTLYRMKRLTARPGAILTIVHYNGE